MLDVAARGRCAGGPAACTALPAGGARAADRAAPRLGGVLEIGGDFPRELRRPSASRSKRPAPRPACRSAGVASRKKLRSAGDEEIDQKRGCTRAKLHPSAPLPQRSDFGHGIPRQVASWDATSAAVRRDVGGRQNRTRADQKQEKSALPMGGLASSADVLGLPRSSRAFL